MTLEQWGTALQGHSEKAEDASKRSGLVKSGEEKVVHDPFYLLSLWNM